MKANAKIRRKLLASLLTLVLVTGMLPVSAFAENDPAAAGVAAENAKGGEEPTGEKTGTPSNPNELPGPSEDKKQDAGSEEPTAKKTDSSGDPGEQPGPGEDKKQGAGGEEPSPTGSPAPSPSNNEQGTPPAAPQESTSNAAPHTHEFGAEWKSDGANHWRECTAGDGQKADEAAHAFGGWATKKQATETEPGSKERACTVCGYAETEKIHATGATRQRTLLGAQGGVDIDEANFPDANFRQYVKSNFDADGNDALSAEEIAAVKQIACQTKDIASLKGVEHFTALERLYCWRNKIASLDLSRNTALKLVRA